MAIPSSLVGMTVPSVVHAVDERWTMAYSASLGDDQAAYFDTAHPDGVIAHPMFPVCVEWPVIVSSRSMSEQHGVTAAEVLTCVHATHDVTIHRLIRPGDALTTNFAIVGLDNVPPGARSTTRLETVDADGLPVATTTQDAIYLGIPARDPDQPDATPPPPIEATERRGDPVHVDIALDAGTAHVYTECARIWNPIHTDRAVAQSCGLPDVILHGTATLAHGVSTVVAQATDGRPELVRRIACRFSAMVLLPSTITVRVWPANDTADGHATVPFEVLNAAGDAAVKNGLVVLGDPHPS